MVNHPVRLLKTVVKKASGFVRPAADAEGHGPRESERSICDSPPLEGSKVSV